MKIRGTVGEKGQITIPKVFRKALGLSAGSELEFREQDGRLVAQRVMTHDPLDALVGLGGQQESSDGALVKLRGPARNRKLDGR